MRISHRTSYLRRIIMYNSGRCGSARSKVATRRANIEFRTIHGFPSAPPNRRTPLLLNLFQFARLTYCISTASNSLIDSPHFADWYAPHRKWIFAFPKFHISLHKSQPRVTHRFDAENLKCDPSRRADATRLKATREITTSSCNVLTGVVTWKSRSPRPSTYSRITI